MPTRSPRRPKLPREPVRGPSRRAARAVLAGVLALAFGCSPPSSQAGRSDAGTRSGEWYLITIDGTPAGHLHREEVPLPEGAVATRTRTEMSLRREATPLRIESSEEVREDAEGRVLGFTLEQTLSEQRLLHRGVVRGEVLEVTTEVEGAPPRRSEEPFDPRCVGPHRTDEILREQLRAEGDQAELVTLYAELQKTATQRVTLGPLEEVETATGTRRLRRARVETVGLPLPVVVQWVDEDLEPVVFRSSILGMEVVYRRTTREEALEATARSGEGPELFVASSVPLGRPIPRGARRVRYRLRWKESASDEERVLRLPEGPAQEVVSEEDDGVVVEVRLATPAGGGGRSEGSEEADAEAAESAAARDFLAPSAMIQSDDPAIEAVAREVAREVAAAERDPCSRARALAEWVHENVRTKNLDTAFATASEVMKRRSGDCTEHAVLLAALARSARIPSRLVAGLVERRGALWGHMWTEVHCGGAWFWLDAIDGEGAAPPDRIALAVSARDGEPMSELFLKLLPVLGKVEVEVVEIEG